MQVQLAILEKYPDLKPDGAAPTGGPSDFRVLDNELVSWDTDLYPEPTDEELALAWLSSVKKMKAKEFDAQAKTLAGEIWLDAMVELAAASEAPKGGPPASTPKLTELKGIQSKLVRARSAAQAVDPSKHNGDPLKAAKAVEDLKWEDL